MDPHVDKDPLLDDVFAEATPADFRGAMLGETLRLAGRKRRLRQARRGAAVCVLAGLIAVLALKMWPERPKDLAREAEIGYLLVRTHSLPAGTITTTQPFAAAQVITSRAAVEVVHTAASQGGFRLINDDELLALVAFRPAALVRIDPETELLIFANPEDELGFPVN